MTKQPVSRKLGRDGLGKQERRLRKPSSTVCAVFFMLACRQRDCLTACQLSDSALFLVDFYAGMALTFGGLRQFLSP